MELVNVGMLVVLRSQADMPVYHVDMVTKENFATLSRVTGDDVDGRDVQIHYASKLNFPSVEQLNVAAKHFWILLEQPQIVQGGSAEYSGLIDWITKKYSLRNPEYNR